MPVMNTSHQDLATCIYKSVYNHMKSNNLHCPIVPVSVATLPCSDSSPLILSRTNLAPRLTSKILQIPRTARIGEVGQRYQRQSHVGFHRAVWSEVEVTADLDESVRTCRQPGGVFFVGSSTSLWSEDRTCVPPCPNDDCPLSFSPRQPTLLLPPAVSAPSLLSSVVRINDRW
jgi:hypothetical protein